MVHEATAIGLRVTSSVEEVVSSASLATWHSMSSTEVILMERQRERVLIVVHGSVSGKLIEAHRKGETRIKPCRLEEEERFRTPLQSPWWAKRRSLVRSSKIPENDLSAMARSFRDQDIHVSLVL